MADQGSWWCYRCQQWNKASAIPCPGRWKHWTTVGNCKENPNCPAQLKEPFFVGRRLVLSLIPRRPRCARHLPHIGTACRRVSASRAKDLRSSTDRSLHRLQRLDAWPIFVHNESGTSPSSTFYVETLAASLQKTGREGNCAANLRQVRSQETLEQKQREAQLLAFAGASLPHTSTWSQRCSPGVLRRGWGSSQGKTAAKTPLQQINRRPLLQLPRPPRSASHRIRGFTLSLLTSRKGPNGQSAPTRLSSLSLSHQVCSQPDFATTWFAQCLATNLSLLSQCNVPESMLGHVTLAAAALLRMLILQVINKPVEGASRPMDGKPHVS